MAPSMGTKRIGGPIRNNTSVRIKIGFPSSGVIASKKLKTIDGAKRLAESAAKRQKEIRGLSLEDRERLAQAEAEDRQRGLFQDDGSLSVGDELAPFDTVPFGDEGQYASHSGGDVEQFPDIHNELANLVG